MAVTVLLPNIFPSGEVAFKRPGVSAVQESLGKLTLSPLPRPRWLSPKLSQQERVTSAKDL